MFQLCWISSMAVREGPPPVAPQSDKSETKRRAHWPPQRLGEPGRIVMTVLGMVAQMERRFIKERQREGIQRAKNEGVYRGGKYRIDRERVKAMHDAGSNPTSIARAVGCSRMQVYRILET